jgi:hypothetical protein
MIEATVRATLEVTVKADEMLRLLEYDSMREREKVEFNWSVQEDVTGEWFSDHMANAKFGDQMANLKAHMEEKFDVSY